MLRAACGCIHPDGLTRSVFNVAVMEKIEESSPLRITPTVQALSFALRGKRPNAPGADSGRGPGDGDKSGGELADKLWFKESSAKNLRNRDFLSPTTMLNTLYADGQVGVIATCPLEFSVQSKFDFMCVLQCY